MTPPGPAVLVQGTACSEGGDRTGAHTAAQPSQPSGFQVPGVPRPRQAAGRLSLEQRACQSWRPIAFVRKVLGAVFLPLLGSQVV
jgi:hypothetical protein